MQFDCELDGEIEQDDYQRIACLRTPDGQSIALTQQLKVDELEAKYEEFVRKEGASAFEKEQTLSPKMQELRQLFDSIKL